MTNPFRVSRPPFHCRDTHIVILLQFHKNSQQLSGKNKSYSTEISPQVILDGMNEPAAAAAAASLAFGPHRPCNRTKMGSQDNKSNHGLHHMRSIVLHTRIFGF
jgi:hypothetical protein